MTGSRMCNLIALMNAHLQPSLTRRYFHRMRLKVMEFSPSRRLICSLFFGMALSICHAADPAAELGSFSVFEKVDLAELAKSDAKTMHGPPMGGRYLSVQSCYVMAGAPARAVEAMR